VFLCSFFGAVCVAIQISTGALLLLDGLYYLSGVKMAISLVKYIPQLLFNAKRQSTVGFSIANILLDLGGGVFSFLQILIDGIARGNFTVVIGNPVKFGLGFTSIIFDLAFIYQHYWLYTERENLEEEILVNESAPLIDPQSHDTSIEIAQQ
jgi:cystinosin